MYWKMYADYRKEHIITTGMCTPRLAEIAHCEIRNLHTIAFSNEPDMGARIDISIPYKKYNPKNEVE